MPTADLDIGTKIFNIEATAGEGPWLIRAIVKDKADNLISFEGATMSMEFRRSGNTGAADYVAQLGTGADEEYAAFDDLSDTDLMINLDEQMTKDRYNSVARITLSTGHSFLLKGVTQIQ